MTARTYEEHKADVEATHPTPPVLWKLYTDNPAHPHDDLALARFEVSYLGRDYVYEVHHSRSGREVISWEYTVDVMDDEGPRRNEGSGRTWPILRDRFAETWETTCERERVIAAHELWARDILVNDGVTLGVVNLSGLNIWGPAQADVALSPTFDADTLAYTASTEFTNVSFRAAASDGATVTWEVGGGSVTGPLISFDLPVGDTVVTVMVSRFEYTPTTYTVTITREEAE